MRKSPEQKQLLELPHKVIEPAEGLINLLAEMSEQIEKEELAALETESWLRDQRYRMERIEANTTAIVTAAKVDPSDSDSKLLFGNDKARGAEVSRRCSENSEYKEIMAAVLANEYEQKVRRLKIDRLMRDHRTALSHLNFLATARKGG